MPATQAEKAERFRVLHAHSGAFVIPNPWDAGTARILESLGFEALTTTSAGLAFTLGRRDGDAFIPWNRQKALGIGSKIVAPLQGCFRAPHDRRLRLESLTYGLRRCHFDERLAHPFNRFVESRCSGGEPDHPATPKPCRVEVAG